MPDDVKLETNSVISSGTDALASVWQPVYDRHPVLKNIVDSYGDRSVFEYVQSFLTPFPQAEETRREEWLSVFQDLLTERVGSEMAREVTEQVRAVPLVSTADHHSPLDEPYWMNANLIHSLVHLPEAHPTYNVCLSFASVSLNNALGYPRGLLLHEEGKMLREGIPSYRFYPEAKLLRLSLFPDKDKMATTYGFRPYMTEDVQRLLNGVDLKVKEGLISVDAGVRLRAWISEEFMDDKIMSLKDYPSQITALNAKFWPSYFEPESRAHAPRVIYLEIETLVTELLLRVHLQKPDSLFYKFIFDSAWQSAFLKEFEGVHGAFCSHDEDGTYYFWGLDEKGHRVRLFLRDGELSSMERTIVVPMTAEGVSEALRTKKIFPCMALCYLMMAFYYHVRCMGATSQIRDLTRTKERTINVLRQMGENAEADALTPFPTQDLIGALSLDAMKLPCGDRVLPTGLDILLHGHLSFETIIARSKRVTLKEAMLPYVKDLYNDFCRDLPFPLQDLDFRID